MSEFIKKDRVLSKLNKVFTRNIKFIFVFGFNGCDVLIITKDDKFYSFGSNVNGCLGLGHKGSIEKPTIVHDLCDRKIVDICDGFQHVIARTENGEVFSWGHNNYGQLGIGTQNNEFKPKLISGLNKFIIDIKSGKWHSMALTKTGEVYAWGYNYWGQIGIESGGEFRLTPIKIKGFGEEFVVAISCGGCHSMALTESGRVFSWGSNMSGQLGFEMESNTPKLILFENEVLIEKISCGQSHSLLLSTNGEIYGFGSNSKGQIGNPSVENQCLPMKLNIPNKFTDIAAHSEYDISIGLSIDDNYYVLGESYKTRENIKILKKSEFKSFETIFYHIFRISHKIVNLNFEVSHRFQLAIPVQNGKFGRDFEEYSVTNSENSNFTCRKKFGNVEQLFDIRLISLRKNEVLKVFKELKVINRIKSDYISEYYDSWLEEYSVDIYSLYIRTESYSKTLKQAINQINEELNQKLSQKLTPIGYYISSELFKEILEGMNFLHKQKIVHRNLNSSNIFISDGIGGNFVKIGNFGFGTFSETLEERNRTYNRNTDMFCLGVIFQELFYIEDNKVFKIKGDSLLKFKYSNLHKFSTDLSVSIDRLRVNCDLMLRKSMVWALCLCEIDKYFVLKKIKDDLRIPSFHSSIVRRKWKYHKRKAHVNNQMTIY